MTYKVKHSIPYSIRHRQKIFSLFLMQNESKTATGHTIEEAIAHLKQLN